MSVAQGLFILLLTVLAYLPSMKGGFIWDDSLYVVENTMLRSVEGLGQIVFDPFAYKTQYYPITYATLWANYQVGGEDTLGYHIFNVFFHALNGVLVWLLLRRLSIPGAFLAGLLFALHPVHVESVAWISERKNVLSGFFCLATLLAWTRFSDTRTWSSYVGVILLFIGGMWSKTITGILLVPLLLWGWWRRGRTTKSDLLALLPLCAITFLLVRITVLLEHQHTSGTDYGISPLQSFLIAGRALWFYVGKLVYPVDLMAIYPKWPTDTHAVQQYLAPVSYLCILLVLWLKRRRIGRGPFLGVFLFVLIHFPTLTFVDFGFLGHSYVSDHFQYLPSISLIALGAACATLLAGRLVQPRGLRLGLAALVVGALAALTWQQNHVWQSKETFWRHNLEKNPTHTAYGALGDVYLRRGQLEEAMKLITASLHAKENARGYYRLAELYRQQKEYDKALENFEKASEVNARRDKIQDMEPRVRFNMGSICWNQGKWQKAAEYWERALAANPEMEIAQTWLKKAQERLEREPQP